MAERCWCSQKVPRSKDPTENINNSHFWLKTNFTFRKNSEILREITVDVVHTVEWKHMDICYSFHFPKNCHRNKASDILPASLGHASITYRPITSLFRPSCQVTISRQTLNLTLICWSFALKDEAFLNIEQDRNILLTVTNVSKFDRGSHDPAQPDFSRPRCKVWFVFVNVVTSRCSCISKKMKKDKLAFPSIYKTLRASWRVRLAANEIGARVAIARRTEAILAGEEEDERRILLATISQCAASVLNRV